MGIVYPRATPSLLQGCLSHPTMQAGINHVSFPLPQTLPQSHYYTGRKTHMTSIVHFKCSLVHVGVASGITTPTPLGKCLKGLYKQKGLWVDSGRPLGVFCSDRKVVLNHIINSSTLIIVLLQGSQEESKVIYLVTLFLSCLFFMRDNK